MAKRELKRHEPLGLSYFWPPTVEEAIQAEQAPHHLGELLRILSRDSQGRLVWTSHDDMAEEIGPEDVRLWAADSGASEHFSEPEIDELDRERQRKVMALREQSGPINAQEMADAKAYGRLTAHQRMVVALSLSYNLDPRSLMKLDYPMLRGMMAKAGMDQRQRELAQRQQSRRK